MQRREREPVCKMRLWGSREKIRSLGVFPFSAILFGGAILLLGGVLLTGFPFSFLQNGLCCKAAHKSKGPACVPGLRSRERRQLHVLEMNYLRAASVKPPPWVGASLITHNQWIYRWPQGGRPFPGLAGPPLSLFPFLSKPVFVRSRTGSRLWCRRFFVCLRALVCKGVESVSPFADCRTRG